MKVTIERSVPPAIFWRRITDKCGAKVVNESMKAPMP